MTERMHPLAAVTTPDALRNGYWLADPAHLERARRQGGPRTWTGRAARSVAEAMFATHAGPPPADRLDWLALDLEDFLEHVGARARWTFRFALHAVHFVGPAWIGRTGTFADLPVAARVEILNRFEHGMLPQTAAVLVLKAILCLMYYEHPDAAREIDFDGQCRGPVT